MDGGGFQCKPIKVKAPGTAIPEALNRKFFDVALDRRWANVLPTDAQISEPTDTYSRATGRVYFGLAKRRTLAKMAIGL